VTVAGSEGKRPAPIFIIIAAIVALSLVIGFAVVSSAKGLESKSNADTAEALMSSAFSGTDGGDMLAALPDGPTEYYVSVSGVPVARAKTEAQLKAILDRIVSENSVENADVAYFEQDVQILYGVVSVELPNDEEEIYKLLSPSSENGLTVISEIRSDVLVATAYKTVTVDRDDLYPDQSYEVKNSGRDGLTEQFSEFTYVNGELTENRLYEILSEQKA